MAPSLLRSVGLVTSLSLMQLITQFALQIIIAKRFGASATMDAFNAALTLPSTLTTILMVSLSYVLIPALTQALSTDRRDPNAWRLATATGTWMIAIGILCSLAISSFSSSIIRFLCPGFEPATHAIASACLQVLAWQFALGVIVSWLNSLENASLGFGWPAMVAFLTSIFNLVLAYQWLESGILGYAWSIIVTGLLQIFLLVIPLRQSLFQFWSVTHPDLPRLVGRWFPLLIGGAYVRFDPLVDRYLGSALEEGSIAHLGYAQRLIQALLALASGGLLTVIFPTLTSSDPNDPGKGLAKRLRLGFHGLVMVIVPVMLGGYIFAEWTIRDLLERGEFLPMDTLAVARLLQILLWMFAGASITDLLARGHYTVGNTWTPTVMFGLLITVIFIAKFAMTSTLGVEGLAWCTSAYFILTTIGLGYSMTRISGSFVDKDLGWNLVWSLLASAIACGFAYAIAYGVGRNGTFFAAPLGALIYAGIQYPMIRKLR